MSLTILIDGYNDVVEELYEIKEVRAWTRELLNKFPHIVYFLEQEVTECHRIIMLNVSTIETTVYAGEQLKKPISEYSTEEIIQGLPRTKIIANISNKLLERIVRKTLTFGASIGDLQGAITATTKIVELFENRK